MSNQKSKASGFNFVSAFVAIVIALGIGVAIYLFVLGNPNNFDAEGEPKPGNYMGMMHAGGFIVPLLIGILLIVITFTVERLITIAKAKGKGNTTDFVIKIKSLVAAHQYDEAIAACDKQKGSLANVVRAGVEKLKYIHADNSMDKETKVAAIQKEIEEATALELPMLSQNLVIISTCASIATLWGLIGTVLGMIRSFAALANAGAPDTSALSKGISEALINTALGIGASVIGIIAYNYFSTRVDAITYSMDEAGFTIVQSVNASK
ncbi:MAG TPA: MotA/TolQ/ExbB proton channel family protein [Bacteroidia bacterium]|jgi:biopolymer transport protein ExbB|nr:MotA/TolQ/ExbB proton channel family protein [Bacteroidia bacterium]